MPIPPFPSLPDDDPIEAIRLLRKYTKSMFDSFSQRAVIAFCAIGPVSLFFLMWMILGYERALLWGSDLVPLGFAVISVIVSAKPLHRPKHQIRVVIFVLVMGALGTVVMPYCASG